MSTQATRVAKFVVLFVITGSLLGIYYHYRTDTDDQELNRASTADGKLVVEVDDELEVDVGIDGNPVRLTVHKAFNDLVARNQTNPPSGDAWEEAELEYCEHLLLRFFKKSNKGGNMSEIDVGHLTNAFTNMKKDDRIVQLAEAASTDGNSLKDDDKDSLCRILQTRQVPIPSLTAREIRKLMFAAPTADGHVGSEVQIDDLLKKASSFNDEQNRMTWRFLFQLETAFETLSVTSSLTKLAEAYKDKLIESDKEALCTVLQHRKDYQMPTNDARQFRIMFFGTDSADEQEQFNELHTIAEQLSDGPIGWNVLVKFEIAFKTMTRDHVGDLMKFLHGKLTTADKESLHRIIMGRSFYMNPVAAGPQGTLPEDSNPTPVDEAEVQSTLDTSKPKTVIEAENMPIESDPSVKGKALAEALLTWKKDLCQKLSDAKQEDQIDDVFVGCTLFLKYDRIYVHDFVQDCMLSLSTTKAKVKSEKVRHELANALAQKQVAERTPEQESSRNAKIDMLPALPQGKLKGIKRQLASWRETLIDLLSSAEPHDDSDAVFDSCNKYLLIDQTMPSLHAVLNAVASTKASAASVETFTKAVRDVASRLSKKPNRKNGQKRQAKAEAKVKAEAKAKAEAKQAYARVLAKMYAMNLLNQTPEATD